MKGLYVFLKRWVEDRSGLAATEFALIFPMMLTLLMGVFDLGYGILAAQKTIRASQVTGDLIARHDTVTEADVQDAVAAGQLALLPFSAGTFEYNITSLEFTNDSGGYDVLWSRGTGAPFGSFSLTDLGVDGQGLVVVQVRYTYEPFFLGFMFDTFTFNEVSFFRGRFSETITMS